MEGARGCGGPGIDQHVRRFDVAMHDARGVRGAERVREQRADTRDDLGEDRPALLDLGEQRSPAHELHDDERRIAAGRASDVVHAQDVRVLEARRRARLAMEPAHDLVAPREVREQTLIATSRRSSGSRARNTVAMPPSPTSSTSV